MIKLSREFHEKPKPVAGAGHQLKLALQQIYTILNVPQAHAFFNFDRIEANAIIFYLQCQHFVAAQDYAGFTGLCIFGDVIERLLHDAEYIDRLLIIEVA